MASPEPAVEHEWRARTLRPIIPVYVLGVFLGFMALAHFVFRSDEAVKALFLAAVGSLVALTPNVLARVEYRFTDAGLDKRPAGGKRARPYKPVFSWDALSHLVPTRSGFKFYNRIEESNPVARVVKLHILGEQAGEFHVEWEDRRRVEEIVHRRGVPVLRVVKGRRIDSASRTGVGPAAPIGGEEMREKGGERET